MSKKTVTVFFLAQAMVAGTGYEKQDTLKVDEDTFNRLRKLGLVKEFDEETDGVEKEQEDCGDLEEKVTTLEGEKSDLEEKVTTLEEKVDELQTAQDEIERLNGLVKAAIELPKGQTPDGFEG